jgi:hypothetical protein
MHKRQVRSLRPAKTARLSPVRSGQAPAGAMAACRRGTWQQSPVASSIRRLSRPRILPPPEAPLKRKAAGQAWLKSPARTTHPSWARFAGRRLARRARVPKVRFDGRLTSWLRPGISARICHRNRNQLQSGAAAIVYRRGTITLSAGMTDLVRSEEPEDPNELRSAAVDAPKDAARQTDPREFNRLTRHVLALIERARAIAQGRQHRASEEAEAQASQSDDQANPQLPHKIAEFFVKLRRV